MADIIKICDFCHEETKYVPLIVKATKPNIYPPAKNRDRTIKIHFCDDCQAEYVFWGSNPSINLYTKINGNLYRWSMDTLLGTAARLWHIKEPGIPGVKQNSKLDLLKTFNNDIPKITPQNVNEKIKLMLLFM